MSRFPALAAAVAVLVVAGVGLTLSHHSARGPLPGPVAISAVLNSSQAREILPDTHFNRVTAGPVDSTLERVSFFAGPRIVAQFAVQRDGSVTQAIDFTRMRVPYGDWIAYEPGVLLGLAVLFALMAGVAPLWRLRNLDVAAALSLIAPVVLLQQRLVDASVLTAVPGLLYLAARAGWVALRPAGDASAHARDAAPATPLFRKVTPGLDGRERVRVLRMLLFAMALTFVMVGVSSPAPVDVIFAVMEGATKLIHGVLPYGHMPGDVVHGDTYPILSYALYTPLAAVAPVRSTWNSVDGALGIAVAAALAGAWAICRTMGGSVLRRRPARPPEVEEAGLRAALAWLAFPPVLVAVSTGTTDVMMAGLLAFAIVLWRRPAASTGLLAAAGWFKLAPFALVPVWLAPRRGRDLLAAVAVLVAVSVAMLALLVGFGGLHGPIAMLHSLGYQFSRGSPQSLWAVLGIPGLQPVGEAAVLALIAAGAVRLHRDAALATDPLRVAALAAAVLIGLQLAADYWSFLYIAWVVPLLGVSVLGDAVTAATTEPVAADASALGGLTPAPA